MTTAVEPTMRDLRQRFPAVFGRYDKPLKLGIFADVVAAFGPQVSPRRLQGLITGHTSRRAYLAAIAKGGARFALDGSAHGAITAAEQDNARQSLATLAQQEKDAREAVGQRAMFLKAVEGSGLNIEAYAAANGLELRHAHSLYDKATHERSLRRQQREALVAKYEASGLSAEAFSRQTGVRLKALNVAIEKIAQTRSRVSAAA